MAPEPDISISVVSHLQMALVAPLLDDIARHCRTFRLEIIVTLNLAEDLPFDPDCMPWPVVVLRNQRPMGFGANHNRAFKVARARYFCVLNPDIRMDCDPFGALVAVLTEPGVGVVGPVVLGPDGEVENSARVFPSPWLLFKKTIGLSVAPDYPVSTQRLVPDWIAGMFMLFPYDFFEKLGGFDERYFLYFEDVDICARVHLLGYEVVLSPDARVVHHAQRSSWRKFRYACWHFSSMLRFFLSPAYWRVLCKPT